MANYHDKVPSFLKDAIREKHKALKILHPGKHAAAFLDFDGSLIDGDITEGKKKGQNTYMGLMDLAIMGGYIPGYSGKEGLEAFWKKYREDFPKPDLAYIWTAELVANLSTEEDKNLKDFIRHHLKDLVERYLFLFARDLLSFFKEEGIVPFVVSASPHFFVKELAPSLPIPAENLYGLNGRKEKGDYVDSILHDAEGKEKRVEAICSQGHYYPLFAMGNKWRWDGMMIQRVCKERGVGLLVNEGGPSNYTHASLYYFDIR